MELLNVITARSMWFMDVAELNPRGKNIFPDLLDWLKDTYSFEKSPRSVTDVDETKGLLFSGGSFQVKEEIFVTIVELKLYNDGLIANTQSSTQDTDAFLEHAMRSASAEFNLAYRPSLIRQRFYLSELNIMSEKHPNGINQRLVDFATKISESIEVNPRPSFDFAGVGFFPRQGFGPWIFSPFVFERKLNTNPSEKKFYSKAPLHTHVHLELLKEFEELFMA